MFFFREEKIGTQRRGKILPRTRQTNILRCYITYFVPFGVRTESVDVPACILNK